MNEVIFDGENAKELSVSETIHQLRLDNKYLELQIINLQSKIDKAIEYIENNLEVDEHDDYVVDLGKNENELLDILKEDK